MRSELFVVLTTVLSIFLATSVYAQKPSIQVQRFPSDIGLSHRTITNMMMDSDGFIWLATMDGLNRFDGHSIKVYKSNSIDSTSISDSFIHGIHEHSSGKLWVSTRDGGLNEFDLVRDTFSDLNEQISGLYDKPISMLYKHGSGRYWVSYFGQGLGIINEAATEVKYLNLKYSNTDKNIESPNAVVEFNNGSMLFSSYNGLYFLSENERVAAERNPEFARDINVLEVAISKDLTSANISNLYIDSLGQLWINIVEEGLRKVQSNQLPSYLRNAISSGVKGNSSSSMVVEKEGYLISGYLDGNLLVHHLASDKTEWVKVLDDDVVQGATYIYEDHKGGVWLYTWGAGFYSLSISTGMSHYNNEKLNETMSSDFMLGFEWDPQLNKMWVGTAEGLDLFDLEAERMYPIALAENEEPISGVWDLHKGQFGLWVTHQNKGLIYISNEELKRKGAFKTKRFKPNEGFVLSEKLMHVFEDSRGWLWLGYEGDGLQVIKNTHEWLEGRPAIVEHYWNNGYEISLSSNKVRTFYEDRNQNIWIATLDAGFSRLNISGNRITSVDHISHEQEASNSLPHNDGRSIYHHQDGTFWFATYGGGVTRWNELNNSFIVYSENDGFPNNSTYSVLSGNDESYVWSSTNLGLAKIHIPTNKITKYVEEDGLQNNEFNTGAYLRLPDNRLVFGGINGFNIIEESAMSTTYTEPKVVLTNIDLFNEAIETDTTVPYLKNLILPWHQNFLSFEFALLDYGKPIKNSYSYMMDGIDESWIESGNRNFAGYPNLPSGNYTFKVKALNSDGIPSANTRTINIQITPPFWQTLWFRLLIGISLLVGLIYTVKYISQRRLREQLRKLELENKLRNERERISRDLHDHVGAQLANIISGLSLVNQYNKVEAKDKSLSLVESLKGDAQITIKQLRDTIWALNQNAMTVRDFRDHLMEYFKNQSALMASMNVEIAINGGEDITLSSTQALNLFRVIQEAAQNTLKYAGAESLAITFCVVNQTLQVSIKDDGEFKGSIRSFDHGYGMGNMQKRAKELNGKLTVNTDNGTTIQVEIPVT